MIALWVGDRVEKILRTSLGWYCLLEWLVFASVSLFFFFFIEFAFWVFWELRHWAELTKDPMNWDDGVLLSMAMANDGLCLLVWNLVWTISFGNYIQSVLLLAVIDFLVLFSVCGLVAIVILLDFMFTISLFFDQL